MVGHASMQRQLFYKGTVLMYKGQTKNVNKEVKSQGQTVTEVIFNVVRTAEHRRPWVIITS